MDGAGRSIDGRLAVGTVLDVKRAAGSVDGTTRVLDVVVPTDGVDGEAGAEGDALNTEPGCLRLRSIGCVVMKSLSDGLPVWSGR